MKTLKTVLRRVTASILALALCIPMFNGMHVPTAEASVGEYVKSVANTRIGFTDVSNPVRPYGLDPSDYHKWKGSYVCFGKYYGYSLFFRVLDNRSTDYADEETVFLDCDTVLYMAPFNADSQKEDAGKWDGSDIQKDLNGAGFYNKEGVLTDAEKAAIASSYRPSVDRYGVPDEINDIYGSKTVALNGEKIFLLDISDVLNPRYGFYNPDDNTIGLQDGKYASYDDGYVSWWLRSDGGVKPSTDVAGSLAHHAGTAGFKHYDTEQVDESLGIGPSPAFHLKRSSILLTSVVTGNYGDFGSAYKLTLLDEEIQLNVSDVSYNGKNVSFKYSLSGSRAGEFKTISYVISRAPFDSYSNTMLAYGTVNKNSGKGTFTIPEAIGGKPGEDFYITILAEDIHGVYGSDYASAPVTLPVPEADFQGKNVTNTDFGTDNILNPRTPTNEDDLWQGNYVYFGKYDGTPIRFRVLSRRCSTFSKNKTLFLDSDKVLTKMVFNDVDFDEYDDDYPWFNVWTRSTIRDRLNGSGFLTKSNGFTAAERTAIAESTVATHDLSALNAGIYDGCDIYAALSEDKIFLLDLEDVLNPTYGYLNAAKDPETMTSTLNVNGMASINSKLSAFDDTVIPVGSPRSYWLRNEVGDYHAPLCGSSGNHGFKSWQVNEKQGVAPALNVNINSILFSTAINGKTGSYGTEFKLTLIDPNIALNIESFTQEWNKVTFSYTLTGKDAGQVTQLSYVITTKAPLTKIEQLSYYGKVTATGSKTATFYLPSSLADKEWGEDFHVYVIAEDINGVYESDYASELVELDSSKMLILFDLTSGRIKLNNTQKEVLSYLLNKKLIKAHQDGSGTIVVDFDRSGTDDVVTTMQNGNVNMELLISCDCTRQSFNAKDLGGAYYGVMFVAPSSGTGGRRARFDRHSLFLADEIGVKFGVVFPDGVDPTGSYVEFESSDGRVGRTLFIEAEQDLSDSSVNRYYFPFRINALELADTITATLHYGKNQTATDKYCAFDYIQTIQSNPDLYGEKNVAIVNALQDYGYYMQRSGWSDNGTHVEIAEPTRYLDTDSISVALSGVSSYNILKDIESAGIADVKIALSLNSRTELKIYVRPEDRVAITSGGYIEEIYGGAAYCVYSFADIGPKNLDFEYTLNVKTDLGTAHISASALSYIKALMESGSLNPDQMRAMAAYYNYYYAAENY